MPPLCCCRLSAGVATAGVVAADWLAENDARVQLCCDVAANGDTTVVLVVVVVVLLWLPPSTAAALRLLLVSCC